MQNLSPEIKQLAKSSMDKLNERKAAVDKERAGAESELSRARAMAKELERQIEQTKARASSKRSEPHAMRATRASEKGRVRRARRRSATLPSTRRCRGSWTVPGGSCSGCGWR